MDIKELYPHENYATFDRIRKLRWDNGALLKASEYLSLIRGENTSHEQLMDAVEAGHLEAYMALTYGALCSADKNMDFSRFGKVYRDQYLSEYITAASEGMQRYFPDSDHDDDQLDEDWPEPPKTVKKNLIGDIGSASPKKNMGLDVKNSSAVPSGQSSRSKKRRSNMRAE